MENGFATAAWHAFRSRDGLNTKRLVKWFGCLMGEGDAGRERRDEEVNITGAPGDLGLVHSRSTSAPCLTQHNLHPVFCSENT